MLSCVWFPGRMEEEKKCILGSGSAQLPSGQFSLITHLSRELPRLMRKPGLEGDHQDQGGQLHGEKEDCVYTGVSS
jgi:hypothetical protein